ncbi:hypothetical protein Tco_1169895 [Tanacetum coccineum]
MLEFFSTCRMSDTVMDLDAPNTLCFQLGGERRSMTWRQFIVAMGLHTDEEIAQPGFEAYWTRSERIVPDKGDLRDYWIEISSDRDFLGATPSYVHIRDHVRRLYHRMIAYTISGRGQGPKKVTGVDFLYLRTMDHGTANVPYLLAQYLFHHAEGRKGGARLSGGYFIGRLAMHFGLLGSLNIYTRYDDTWAWVASGPERQQAAAAGAHEVDEGGLAAEEDREGRGRYLMDASGHPYQAFGSTLVGSSRMPYQRRVRPRTGDASTSAAPHADDQPDP